MRKAKYRTRKTGCNPLSSKPKVKSFCSFDADIFNACNPIVSIQVHNNGVATIKRKSLLQGQFNNSDNGRENRKIKMFSAKSMARLVATINSTDVEFKTMITLTYPLLFPMDGEAVKTDINRFLSMLRSKQKHSYLWFLEFQRRGAPHLHVLTTLHNITKDLRWEIAFSWVQGIAKSDWLQQEAARVSLHSVTECEYDIQAREVAKAFKFTLRRDTFEHLRKCDGAARYATKYATKEYQKEPPVQYKGVGRFWGCSKDVGLGNGYELEMDEGRLRSFLNSQEHACGEWDVLPKYLFNLKNL